MATETEKIYEEQTQQTTAPAATETAATPAPATTTETAPAATTETATATTTPTPAVTGNEALDAYNNSRVEQINKLYDSQKDSALTQLEAAHNRTMSDAKAAYEKISPRYQESRNQVGAEYERQRRNNNIQAAANGLNTGAGSQMQLAASNVYQTNQAGLQKAEREAQNEANRNMLTLKEQYEADVSKALSDNDATRAAALLNEYGEQYDRMIDEAKVLAQYGDFSLYANVYGADTASAMERTWMLQNPDLAFTLGKISAEEYFSMTGKWPHTTGGGGGGSSSGGGGGGYYGGGGGGGGGGNNKVDTTYTSVANALNDGYTLDQIKSVANNPSLVEQQYQLATGQKQSTIAPSGSSRSAAGALKNSTSSGSKNTSSNSSNNSSSGGGNILTTVVNAVKSGAQNAAKAGASLLNSLKTKF